MKEKYKTLLLSHALYKNQFQMGCWSTQKIKKKPSRWQKNKFFMTFNGEKITLKLVEMDNKFNYIKIKNFCSIKFSIKKGKKIKSESEKIIAVHLMNKRLSENIWKFWRSKKRTINPIEKWEKNENWTAMPREKLPKWAINIWIGS